MPTHPWPLLLHPLFACSNAPSHGQRSAGGAAGGAGTLRDSTPIAEYVVGSFEASKGVLWFGTMS
jgi:hypothetical protein